MRLHAFEGNTEEINLLKSVGGVLGVLTADSIKRKSYDLNFKETKMISIKGCINKFKILYIKTDIRLEKFVFIQLLLRKNRYTTLTIFTHEDKFIEIEAKLYLLCSIFSKLNINYI